MVKRCKTCTLWDFLTVWISESGITAEVMVVTNTSPDSAVTCTSLKVISLAIRKHK